MPDAVQGLALLLTAAQTPLAARTCTCALPVNLRPLSAPPWLPDSGAERTGSWCGICSTSVIARWTKLLLWVEQLSVSLSRRASQMCPAGQRWKHACKQSEGRRHPVEGSSHGLPSWRASACVCLCAELRRRHAASSQLYGSRDARHEHVSSPLTFHWLRPVLRGSQHLLTRLLSSSGVPVAEVRGQTPTQTRWVASPHILERVDERPCLTFAPFPVHR